LVADNGVDHCALTRSAVELAWNAKLGAESIHVLPEFVDARIPIVLVLEKLRESDKRYHKDAAVVVHQLP
jgi:hypothetical protein